jgi:hypothetical protein
MICSIKLKIKGLNKFWGLIKNQPCDRAVNTYQANFFQEDLRLLLFIYNFAKRNLKSFTVGHLQAEMADDGRRYWGFAIFSCVRF